MWPKSRIWERLLQLCLINKRVGDWESKLRWEVANWRGKSMIAMFLKLAWMAYLYHMWIERNACIHKQKIR